MLKRFSALFVSMCLAFTLLPAAEITLAGVNINVSATGDAAP